MIRLILLLLFLAPVAARADAPAELVGLFIQGCLAHAGDAAAQRGWATSNGLPPVPAQATAAFLHDAPGRAFDGSDAAGKFVLISADDGLCSAVTDQVTQAAMVAATEAGFAQAGLAFRLVIERDDTNLPALHRREYLATRNGAGWRVLLETVKDGGEAMLTGAPELDNKPPR